MQENTRMRRLFGVSVMHRIGPLWLSRKGSSLTGRTFRSATLYMNVRNHLPSIAVVVYDGYMITLPVIGWRRLRKPAAPTLRRSEYGWVLSLGPIHLQRYPSGLVLGYETDDMDGYSPALRYEHFLNPSVLVTAHKRSSHS